MVQLSRLNIIVTLAIFFILLTFERAPTSVLAGRGRHHAGIDNLGYISDGETGRNALAGTLATQQRAQSPTRPKSSSRTPPRPHGKPSLSEKLRKKIYKKRKELSNIPFQFRRRS
uniref:Secreted protein n=1 Tax=Rhipicephalus zambeziensis TaxID=60191 RepID=A0A224YL13_9ACAR